MKEAFLLSCSFKFSTVNFNKFMGIFNFFIVLPEIIASLFFGKIMTNFLHNDKLTAVLVGGCLLIIAGIVCAFIVKENDIKNTVKTE